MIVTIQFKNRKNEFVGKTYDYELAKGEDIPAVGQVIRMMNENYDYICYGTRVKVVDVKENSNNVQQSIRYVNATMDC